MKLIDYLKLLDKKGKKMKIRDKDIVNQIFIAMKQYYKIYKFILKKVHFQNDCIKYKEQIKYNEREIEEYRNKNNINQEEILKYNHEINIKMQEIDDLKKKLKNT